MAKSEVVLTIRIDTAARQIRAISLSSDLDPFVVAIVANQLALRAMKQYADEQQNKAKAQIKIVQPSAVESIAALNGNGDVAKLRGGK